MSINRRLPKSNLARQQALERAKNKNDLLPPPPADQVLNASTVMRLNDTVPTYLDAVQAVNVARANMSANTPAKDAKVEAARLFTGHFIQVFNLGVKRNKYPKAHRAHYQLDVESDALPNLDSEANALTWADKLVTGDVTRLAAGGVAMANPAIAEVDTALGEAIVAFNAQTTLKDALDEAQEALEVLNEDADALIKRIWNEVEAYYSEEDAESMRNNARDFGVVYVTDAAVNTLTGLVKNASGVAQQGATVTVVESGSETTTNSEGRYTQETALTGTITIRATLGALSGEVQVTIAEDAEGTTIAVPDIVIV